MGGTSPSPRNEHTGSQQFPFPGMASSSTSKNPFLDPEPQRAAVNGSSKKPSDDLDVFVSGFERASEMDGPAYRRPPRHAGILLGMPAFVQPPPRECALLASNIGDHESSIWLLMASRTSADCLLTIHPCRKIYLCWTSRRLMVISHTNNSHGKQILTSEQQSRPRDSRLASHHSTALEHPTTGVERRRLTLLVLREARQSVQSTIAVRRSLP